MLEVFRDCRMELILLIDASPCAIIFLELSMYVLRWDTTGSIFCNRLFPPLPSIATC